MMSFNDAQQSNARSSNQSSSTPRFVPNGLFKVINQVFLAGAFPLLPIRTLEMRKSKRAASVAKLRERSPFIMPKASHIDPHRT